MCKQIETKVYIDKPFQYIKKRERFSHMISDDTQYLHEFAKSIGLPKFRFENKYHKNQPHYDVPETFYKAAIEKGAIPVDRKHITKLLRAFHDLKKIKVMIKNILITR